MALEKDLDTEIGRKFKGILLKQLEGAGLKESYIKIDSEWRSLDADYIDLLEMRGRVEEVYGIEVINEEADKILTVGQAIDYITSKYNNK